MLVAGCASEAELVPVTPPREEPAAKIPQPTAPAAAPAPPVRPAVTPEPTRSAASQALSQHYARLQSDLVTQGLLRGDGGGPDTPFTDTMLARNFIRIALFDEYVPMAKPCAPRRR
ncbi:hypothetical protein [Limimaricola cinnabarinus]|uniref:hypothetical protein n=1 Tax=Limimaricola cinnabarinus TaxID=1125964 RepID=UPI000427BB38